MSLPRILVLLASCSYVVALHERQSATSPKESLASLFFASAPSFPGRPTSSRGHLLPQGVRAKSRARAPDMFNLPRIALPDDLSKALKSLDLKDPNELNDKDYNGYGGAALLGTLAFYLFPGSVITDNSIPDLIRDFVFSAITGGGVSAYAALRKDEIGKYANQLGGALAGLGDVPRISLPDSVSDVLKQLDLKNPNDLSTADYNTYSGAAILGTLFFLLLPGAAITETDVGAVLSDFIVSALAGGGAAAYAALRKDAIGEKATDIGGKLVDSMSKFFEAAAPTDVLGETENMGKKEETTRTDDPKAESSTISEVIGGEPAEEASAEEMQVEEVLDKVESWLESNNGLEDEQIEDTPGEKESITTDDLEVLADTFKGDEDVSLDDLNSLANEANIESAELEALADAFKGDEDVSLDDVAALANEANIEMASEQTEEASAEQLQAEEVLDNVESWLEITNDLKKQQIEESPSEKETLTTDDLEVLVDTFKGDEDVSVDDLTSLASDANMELVKENGETNNGVESWFDSGIRLKSEQGEGDDESNQETPKAPDRMTSLPTMATILDEDESDTDAATGETTKYSWYEDESSIEERRQSREAKRVKMQERSRLGTMSYESWPDSATQSQSGQGVTKRWFE